MRVGRQCVSGRRTGWIHRGESGYACCCSPNSHGGRNRSKDRARTPPREKQGVALAVSLVEWGDDAKALPDEVFAPGYAYLARHCSRTPKCVRTLAFTQYHSYLKRFCQRPEPLSGSSGSARLYVEVSRMSHDPLTPQQRSERMARVRSTGNRSTEGRIEATLVECGINGWVKQSREIRGRPDFYFPAANLAVFVDGCFWHGCPKCCRMPRTRREYWVEKITGNRRRDDRLRRQLRREGTRVMRVWEHDLKRGNWLNRLRRMLAAGSKASMPLH
jgi:DNA mismatch endonuclease (patch repair protein)